MSQSVEMQMKWKSRFNEYLAEAIHDVPENERVILDTGDGAAVCFLGAPEAAMFAALHLWQCFVRDEREHGINAKQIAEEGRFDTFADGTPHPELNAFFADDMKKRPR